MNYNITTPLKPPLPLPPINPNIYDTSNHSRTLSFPSLNISFEPRSNTPESDNNSILSINTTNTIPIKPLSPINILNIASTSSPPTPPTIVINQIEYENEYDSDYFPIPSKNIKLISKKKSKPKPNSKVLPIANGHLSIKWDELCNTKLECHICYRIYNNRNKYIECLKTHYNNPKNDLVYLECELCLINPTKKNLQKKEKLLKKNIKSKYSTGNEWRTSKHVANFISHLAGHECVKPGFYCNVKVYNSDSNKYVLCNAAATTQQNLAKHIYSMHYKCNDKLNKYCIDCTFGYIAKNKLKLLQKKYKNKNKNKRKRNTNTNGRNGRNDNGFIIDDTPKLKKRKLDINTKEKHNYNYKYKTLNEQYKFMKYLSFVAAPKLSKFADYCIENV